MNDLDKHTEQNYKGIYIFLLIVFLIIFFFSSYNIYLISKHEDSQYRASYTKGGRTDYFVTISNNDFIEDRALPSGKSYITELTEKITFTKEYNFDSNVDLDFNRRHEITATIIGRYNQNPNSNFNPVIWEKEHSIKPEKTETFENASEFNIRETFEIDLREYNREARSFKEKFQIPVVIELVLAMPVSVNGSNSDYRVNDSSVVESSIPLDEKVFTINVSEQDQSENYIQELNETEEQTIDQRKLSLYIVIFVSSLSLIVITINKIRESLHNICEKDLIKKIKKDYDHIIVETKNMVDTHQLIPINITNFEEMLDLANTKEQPIMLYEEDKVAVFYIIIREQIYSYIVKIKN